MACGSRRGLQHVGRRIHHSRMPRSEHPDAPHQNDKDRQHRPVELLAFRFHRRDGLLHDGQHRMGFLRRRHLLYPDADSRRLYGSQIPEIL